MTGEELQPARQVSRVCASLTELPRWDSLCCSALTMAKLVPRRSSRRAQRRQQQLVVVFAWPLIDALAEQWEIIRCYWADAAHPVAILGSCLTGWLVETPAESCSLRPASRASEHTNRTQVNVIGEANERDLLATAKTATSIAKSTFGPAAVAVAAATRRVSACLSACMSVCLSIHNYLVVCVCVVCELNQELALWRIVKHINLHKLQVVHTTRKSHFQTAHTRKAHKQPTRGPKENPPFEIPLNLFTSGCGGNTTLATSVLVFCQLSNRSIDWSSSIGD